MEVFLAFHHWTFLPGRVIPIKERPTAWLLIFWTLAAAVIFYSFKCSIIAGLTKPAIEKPMETWQDLIDNDYVIQTPHSYFNGSYRGNGTMFYHYAQVNLLSLMMLA